MTHLGPHSHACAAHAGGEELQAVLQLLRQDTASVPLSSQHRQQYVPSLATHAGGRRAQSAGPNAWRHPLSASPSHRKPWID